MDGFIDFVKVWFPVVSSLVGTFALVATITPNRSDNAIADILCRFVNFLGANFGQAKNKD